MKLVWKNCTQDTLAVYVNNFAGKPVKVVRPTEDLELDLPAGVTKAIVHVFGRKAVVLLERQVENSRKVMRVLLDGTEESL